MRVLGVDPGATGAMAMLDTGLDGLVVVDMPFALINKRRVLNETVMADLLRLYQPDCAWVERVHSLPKQGVSSSFSFGMAYGMVRGALAALGVPTTLVTPQEWKRAFRLGPDKNEARIIAGRQFPLMAASFARVKDDGRAEAALLALFGASQGPA